MNINSKEDEQRELDELQSLIASASMSSLPIHTSYHATANITGSPTVAFSNLQIELLPDYTSSTTNNTSTNTNTNSINNIDHVEEGGLLQHPGLSLPPSSSSLDSYTEGFECHDHDHDNHDEHHQQEAQGNNNNDNDNSFTSSPASVVPSISYYSKSPKDYYQQRQEHQHRHRHRTMSSSNSISIEADSSLSISLHQYKHQHRCRHEDINNDDDNQYLPGRETPKAKSKHNKHKQLSTRDQCTQTMTLGTRIHMERSILYQYFSLREDFDSTILHIQSTFAPSVLFPQYQHSNCKNSSNINNNNSNSSNSNSKCLRWFRLPLPLLFRILWCYWTFGILLTDHRDAMRHRKMCNVMYFGHLTNITLVLTLCYQCLSTLLSFLGFVSSCCWTRHSWFLPLFHHSNAGGAKSNANASANAHGATADGATANTDVACTPGIIVTMTWFLYSIALPAEFIVAIGFWKFIYNPDEPLTFITIYQHAIIGFLLLFDGNVIGRIPLRLKHCKGLLVYGITYLLWSLVFSYFKLGKRHKGVIYDFMDWRRDPGLAAAIGSLLLFVIGPMVFLTCWWISVSDGGCCFGLLGLCGCGYGGGRRRVVSVSEYAYEYEYDAQGATVKQEQEWVGRNIDLSIDNDITCTVDGKDLESDRKCHDLNKGWNGYGWPSTRRYTSLDRQETDTLSTDEY